MKITIENKIQLEDFPKDLKDHIMGNLTFVNPKFLEAQKLGYSTWNISKYIRNFDVPAHNILKVPRGYRSKLMELLKNKNYDYQITDNRTIYPFDGQLSSAEFKFRNYQRKYLFKLLTNKITEGVITAPPGSGKTVLGIGLAAVLGQPTLWLTHTKSLLKQTENRLTKFVPELYDGDIGTINAGQWEIGNRFTIGMVQTMTRDLGRTHDLKNTFGTVILDEAHHCPANTFNMIISLLNPYYLFGLTATPYRGDKLEQLMFQTIGPVVLDIPTDEIVKEGGILMPTVIYKETDTKRMEGNNTSQLTKYLINNKKRNNMVVKDVLNEAFKGEVCIVLSTRKKHCELLYELLKISWEKTGIATGDYSDKANGETVKQLENGEINVLITTADLLAEGFDVDIISRGFITLPFRSETRTEQFIGRVQRSAPNKTDVIIYDYVDTNIGVFKDQFSAFNQEKECRVKVYNRLGLDVIPAAA